MIFFLLNIYICYGLCYDYNGMKPLYLGILVKPDFYKKAENWIYCWGERDLTLG